MKPKHKKWSKLVLLGEASLDAGSLDRAITYYQRAYALANRLINDTIINFEGDISPLAMYSQSCQGLVRVHQRAGDSAAARLCLEQTAQRLLAVLKNTSYPMLIRGKVIRAFEPLFNVAIQFFQTEGHPDEALAWIGDWLAEVQKQVALTRPIQDIVLMN